MSYCIDHLVQTILNPVKEMKEKVLITPGSKFRLAIATTAFGMEIDCPNIQQVPYYGSPASYEEHVCAIQSRMRWLTAQSHPLLWKTREICREWNGKIQRKDSRLWRQLLMLCSKYLNMCYDVCVVVWVWFLHILTASYIIIKLLYISPTFRDTTLCNTF